VIAVISDDKWSIVCSGDFRLGSCDSRMLVV